MNQINLKADNIRVKTQEQQEGNGALIFSVLLLFVSVGLYGGLRYYHVDQQAKVKALGQDREATLESLSNESYAKVYYFADQLNEIQKVLQSRTSQAAMLEKIGGKIITDFNGAGGTSFQSLKVESQGGASTIGADISIPDFNALSAQLRALNMIEGASDVNASSVTRGEGAQVSSLRAAVAFSLAPVVEQNAASNATNGTSMDGGITVPAPTASAAPITPAP